jgi:hypothetical protein
MSGALLLPRVSGAPSWRLRPVSSAPLRLGPLGAQSRRQSPTAPEGPIAGLVVAAEIVGVVWACVVAVRADAIAVAVAAVAVVAAALVVVAAVDAWAVGEAGWVCCLCVAVEERTVWLRGWYWCRPVAASER